MNPPLAGPPLPAIAPDLSNPPSSIPAPAPMPSGVALQREFTFHHELPASFIPAPKGRATRLLEFAERIVPVLAALGGGVWMLFRFAAFQNAHEDLQLRLDKISLEREQVSFQTLSEERRYALEMARLNVKKTGHELANLEDHPLREDASLTLRKRDTLPGGNGRYLAVLNLVITNISQQAVKISFSVVRQYRGTIKKPTPGAILTRINGPLELGVVDWKLDGEFAGFSMAGDEESPSEIELDGRLFSLAPGGGLTGHLRPTEQRSFSFDYLIVDTNDAFVGFVINVGINGGTEPADQRVFRQWRALFEADDKFRGPAEERLSKTVP